MNWSTHLEAVSISSHEAEMALRLILAAVVSGLIGFEREARGHPAGLRTHILTGLAAAVFTILAFEIYHGTGRNGDPIRIIQAVTAGVAFLAAGTIIQSRGEVHGLTSGAAMWMAGALGVACGGGFYILAILSALATFIVLRFLKILEDALEKREAASDGTAKPGKPPDG